MELSDILFPDPVRQYLQKYLHRSPDRMTTPPAPDRPLPGKHNSACPKRNLFFINASLYARKIHQETRFNNSGFKYPVFPNMISKPFNQDLTNFTITTKSFNSMCVALHFEYSRAFARREEAKWNK